MKSIQLTVTQLQNIIDEVKSKQKYDSSVSDTVEIIVLQENDTHLGGDKIEANVKCNYAECFNVSLNI